MYNNGAEEITNINNHNNHHNNNGIGIVGLPVGGPIPPSSTAAGAVSRDRSDSETTTRRSQVAMGLTALYDSFNEIYPDQTNPMTVTALLKYWLGGPDPLDYISMYSNPGNPDQGIPPHWHYISCGLSDLHGDERVHRRTDKPQSGFGFELTFRLARKSGELNPPSWPANVLQQLAKYVFNSNNLLVPGDHVSWHAPLDKSNSKINQILMTKDPQMPNVAGPFGEVSFVQIVGVTSDELQAAQHWNGDGVISLLKSNTVYGPWLVTDMTRSKSIMEEDPTIAVKIQDGIEREGSNLSGVSALCWWQEFEESTDKYRERKEESDEEGDKMDTKSIIKSERLSPCEQNSNMQSYTALKYLQGLHINFNLEAGRLLKLAIKGRVMHGRHFTFKSVISHAAVTFVSPTVTGAVVSKEKPYSQQGPWLQALIPDDLSEKMAREIEVLNNNRERISLPLTFSWPEHKFAITIVEN